MRARGLLDTLMSLALGFLAFLLIAMLIVAVVAMAYPQIAKVAIAGTKRNIQLFLGTDAEDRLTLGIKNMRIRAGEGYEYRIKPAAGSIRGYVDRYQEGKIKEGEAEDRVKETEECLECHLEIFETTALEHLYYDHELHHEKEIYCQTCHRGSAMRLVKSSAAKHAGEPPSPTEKSCIDCHEKRKIELACAGCHPPGSIFASEIYARADADRFRTEKVNIKWLKGFEVGKSEACARCHEEDRFCVTCHEVKHPPDWREQHGNRVIRREKLTQAEREKFFGEKSTVAIVDCVRCHRTNWCASLCHTNPGTARRSPQRPVPISPLKE